MHETAIAEGILKEAERHGKVSEIFLEIGELAHVPAHELIEALESIVRWKVHWKEIPSEAKCGCGFKGHPKILERGHDSFMIECPKCKSVPELAEGKDIIIRKVIVE